MARAIRYLTLDTNVDPLLEGEIDALLRQLREAPGRDDREAIRRCVTAAARREHAARLGRVIAELRAPLGALRNALGVALRPAPEGPREEHLRRAEERAAEFAALLDDLGAYQRFEAGAVPRSEAPVAPRDLVADLASTWRDRAARKGLAFSANVVGVVPERVLTDGDALRQLLDHLVGHAVRGTLRGGVDLALRANDRDPATLRIVVTDTGPGLDPGDLPRPLQPFEGGSSLEPRSSAGEGLGLALAAHLAAHLGGALAVQATPGEGSELSVAIPVRPAPDGAGAHATVDDRAPPLPALRVLVAEDNRVNQLLVAALLEREGQRVRLAANGREAVEIVREGPVDLALMDLQMPEMNGYEATVQIRALDAARGSHTPIVALTAHDDTAERRRCLAVGMDDFLRKPLDGPALRRALARWHDRAVDPHAQAPRPVPVVDVPALRARVAGRREILQRLVAAFREQRPSQREALRDAAARRNPAEVRTVAHKLIGTLSCFSANPAVALARELERRAVAGEFGDLPERVAALEASIEVLEPELERLVREGFGAEAGP